MGGGGLLSGRKIFSMPMSSHSLTTAKNILSEGHTLNFAQRCPLYLRNLNKSVKQLINCFISKGKVNIEVKEKGPLNEVF